MKRVSTKTPAKLGRVPKELVTMATALDLSGSATERAYWVRLTTEAAMRAMDADSDAPLDAALEHTYNTAPPAHYALVGCCEAAAESVTVSHDTGADFDGLLMAIPIVAWSKYTIPVGAIAAADAAKILLALENNILAKTAKITIDPSIVGMDQLPMGFAGVRAVAKALVNAAVSARGHKVKWGKFTPDTEYMADSRFVLAGIAAPAGEPLFRWQEDGGKRSRAECMAAWVDEARPIVTRLLPGSEFTLLLPDSFFACFRFAEEAMRPATVCASVAFLETRLPTTAPRLRAVIAGVGRESQTDEYRIAFTERGQDQVLTGVIWPLTETEDAETEPNPSRLIEALLREIKVGEVLMLDGVYEPEYCDDCGAPLFPNADGEAMHAYMPEGTESPAAHYH